MRCMVEKITRRTRTREYCYNLKKLSYRTLPNIRPIIMRVFDFVDKDTC